MTSIESILYIILMVLILAVVVLIAVLIIAKRKEKQNQNKNTEIKNEKAPSVVDSNIKVAKEYQAKSVFDFMEFEKVKDNMIIQKKGKRFLMAIECQGVNYDLMSEVEKASTEQGFALFLNILKEPIQIYIQTRTVNLEKNIQNYKARLEKVKASLNLKEYKYKQYLEQDNINEEILKNRKLEVLRENNLYSYGKDIIADTEKMSLNKNVLKKKYYIIIKYYYEPSEGEENLLSEEEISETAFSNLYTNAVSIIRTLSGIGIVGRTLNSFELVDLLYNAYNRDDSEVFGIERAIEAGFNDIYIDAQSAVDKKIAALNKDIELRAKDKVRRLLDEVAYEREEELKQIEENIDDIILNLAEEMLKDENNRIPSDVREKAINKIEQKKKGENKTDGKKETKESNRKRRAG